MKQFHPPAKEAYQARISYFQAQSTSWQQRHRQGGRTMCCLLTLTLMLFCAIPQLSAQVNGIEQTSELVTVGNSKFLRWYGRAGRTYFIQIADPYDPLKRWEWAPIIKSGNDGPISYEVDGTADQGFFRLVYTDKPTTNPENDDFDGDTISNIDEVTSYNGSDPLKADTDSDGMPDNYEVTHYLNPNFNDGGNDDDRDGLTNLQEYNSATDPHNRDTDSDGMDDGFEVIYLLNPLVAGDAANDSDADGLTNLWEYKLKLNPRLTDSNSNGVSDALEDRDRDGLANLLELMTHHTLPDQPDTDGDGLSDGWEILYGYSALLNNLTDVNPTNDPNADPDSDGLVNSAEDQIGTNPNNADTDGDGFSDFVENQASSNATGAGSTPNNPSGTPGGPATTPPPIIDVKVKFGDHSGSHSEKYEVQLEPLEGDANPQKRSFKNSNYGQTQTETFHLPAGAKYKVTLTHTGTAPEYNGDPKPDYDYTLEFTSNSTDTAIKAIPQDTAGILGVHDESENFFAVGKDATLYIAWLKSETVVEIPRDHARKKLGVGEKVALTLKPTSLPGPTWALTGTPLNSALDPMTGSSSFLTAGNRVCNPTAETTVLGEKMKIDFNVIEPTGVTMKQEPGTGIWHIQGRPSAGFRGRPFITPTDVSFIEIQVREGHCNGIGIGYYEYENGEPHQEGSWLDVVTEDASNPSKVDGVDAILSGAAPRDAAHALPSVGTFDWSIPWLFRVDNGEEKQFAIVTHHHESDAAGTVTMSKGGFSVSATINDPTAP